MRHFDVDFRDKNGERYQLSKRIAELTEALMANYFVYDTEVLEGVWFRDGKFTYEQREEGTWLPFDTEHDTWGYADCYAWMKHSFTVPTRFAGRPVYYQILPQEGKKWAWGSPQALLYANGEALQGFDSNHTRTRLLDCAQGGEHYEMLLNLYAGGRDYEGKIGTRLRLLSVDDEVEKLYWHLRTPLEVANLKEPDELARIHLLQTLNEAVSLVSFHLPYGEDFLESVREATAYLEKKLYGKREMEATVSAVGHTHIDVAWLWRLRQTRDKTSRSFATVLKLMEEYPDYRFMSSQAQLYEFIRQEHPAIFARIRESVRQGRWEPEGGMWVEADTNLSSGESLVRQFLVGKRFFRNAFGADCKILWLPDVFGYSAALPQIMKQCGINYFMTTKISWNEYDKLPYDTFLWRGIDGSEVLTHFISTMDTVKEEKDWITTYNGDLNPSQVIGCWQRYQQKDLNRDVLFAFGHGDGGGGPTHGMLERGRRMHMGIEGCPKVEFQFARDYFDRLQKDIAGRKRLPRWVGELYFEHHRGTLTAQASAKRWNRRSEFLYHDLETLESLVNLDHLSSYPSAALLEGWKVILLNQFHDILPGSSIREVYEDSQKQYEDLHHTGGRMLEKALQQASRRVGLARDSLLLFNTLGFSRREVAEMQRPQHTGFLLRDPQSGAVLPWQKTFDGKIIFTSPEVPAKGYCAISVEAGEQRQTTPLTATLREMHTPFFDLTFDEAMQIASLIDRRTGRSVAPQGEPLNRLIVYEDRPFEHRAWNVQAYYTEKSWVLSDVSHAEVLECGPVRAVVLVERKFLHSVIRQYITAYAELDRIDIRNEIDWDDSYLLLKADFPVDVNAVKATFDIQFGNIERVTHENTLWDFAQFESCAHKWADLSDNSFGLAVLNDCKYGYSAKDGHIALTLLRSANDPQPKQDCTHHTFTYSLYPHAGPAAISRVVQEGYSLNCPLYTMFSNAQKGAWPERFSLACVDADNIILETVKRAEDSDALILRLYETWNRATDCSIRFGRLMEMAAQCDMMEENEALLQVEGNRLRLHFRPFEIKTLKVRLEQA
ncbi:MAG: alpha-mannosidase [Acutalibacteraceae bacterium]